MSLGRPLVVILGATGAGKTKLSLELAQKFGGEIISADSMQIYKGLDIITAKATKEERKLVNHHLIDYLEPHELCTVYDFRNRALPIIGDVFSRNKLPIIVGGTNYYIESLLWKILIESDSTRPYVQPTNLHELPSESLHQKLLQLDPIRAQKLHPNDKRKILRSLEILQQQGRRHSEILEEQQSSEGGSTLGGGLRFKKSIIFWLQCEQDVLDERLNLRVDSMIKEGLIDELTSFHKRYNEERVKMQETPDYTKGIFQSIGLKEFHNFLTTENQELNSKESKKLFDESVDELKRTTRRYAKKQKRWIINRFLNKSNRKVPPVFGLDTTNVTDWEKSVRLPAEDILQSYINDLPCSHQSLPVQETNSSPISEADTFKCEVCERTFIGQYQWGIHLKSSKHKKVLESKRKKFKQQMLTFV